MHSINFSFFLEKRCLAALSSLSPTVLQGIELDIDKKAGSTEKKGEADVPRLSPELLP